MNSPLPPRLPGRPQGMPFFCRLLIGIGSLGVLFIILAVVLLHPVENWRGRRAWDKCRHELQARGEQLDWSDYIPPPVPDGKNIFKAPKMAEWFVGRDTNELVRFLNPEKFYDFERLRNGESASNVVAEVTLWTDTNTDYTRFDAELHTIGDGGLVFTRRYVSPANPQLLPVSGLDTNVIPLVILDEVPLPDALANLAHQAHLKYSLDSDVRVVQPNSKDPPAPPDVSISWDDITAEQAILEILDHYGLQGKVDPGTGIFHITADPCASSRAQGFPSVSDQITRMIRSALGKNLKGPQGLTFITGSSDRIRPLHILGPSTSQEPSTINGVRSFFATNGAFSLVSDAGQLQIVRVGTNLFRITSSRPKMLEASDYLAWSDRFVPQFDCIRQTIQRPFARMDGDYLHPFAVPIPNYISIRITSQTLVQRAQCYLLLNQPEKALHELTLVHDLCRLLEGKPTGRPMTLVATMLEAAVTGMYADTVADGLQLRIWREPQLAAIQQQLQAIDLPPLLKESLRGERATGLNAMEILLSTNSVRQLGDFQLKPAQPGSPIRMMPRGWMYQNMVTFAEIHQQGIDCIDLTNEIISPQAVDTWEKQTRSRLGMHFRPYTWFANLVFPNFSRAFQTLAKDQSLAEQTIIACALERYRLVHGQYPDTLNALKPRYLEKLPHDIVNGQSLKYHRSGKDQYALYSVGWNGTDDGGVTATDWKKGDWALASSAK